MEGFKASETLLGIETRCLEKEKLLAWCFKASETLLGIETKSQMKTTTDSQELQSL